MGKAKQQASARADELLKSYNVKLNPIAGTYRLEDKATGKEVNVERSGVDVGTSWFASGRRANRLIGKNLVRRGMLSNTPTTPTEQEKTDISESKAIAGDTSFTNSINTGVKQDTTPLMLRGLPKDQPQYQWQLPNISSIWNGKGSTTSKETTTPALGNNKVYGSRFGSGALTDYTPNLGNPTVGTFDPIMSKAQIRQGLVARQLAPTTNSGSTTQSTTPGIKNDLNSFITENFGVKGYVSPEAYVRRENITESSPDFINWKRGQDEKINGAKERWADYERQELDKKDKAAWKIRQEQPLLPQVAPLTLFQ